MGEVLFTKGSDAPSMAQIEATIQGAMRANHIFLNTVVVNISPSAAALIGSVTMAPTEAPTDTMSPPVTPVLPSEIPTSAPIAMWDPAASPSKVTITPTSGSTASSNKATATPTATATTQEMMPPTFTLLDTTEAPTAQTKKSLPEETLETMALFQQS